MSLIDGNNIIIELGKCLNFLLVVSEETLYSSFQEITLFLLDGSYTIYLNIFPIVGR